MNNIEYLKEISRITSDLGVAVTFMVVFLFIFLIFSIVLTIQMPKLIKSYLNEKNKIKESEIKRDELRWNKHLEITERSYQTMGKNDELLYHIRNESENVSDRVSELIADFDMKTHHIDDVAQSTTCILQDTKALKEMLNDIYKSLEVVKDNNKQNEETKKAVNRIEKAISSLTIYLQDREEV